MKVYLVKYALSGGVEIIDAGPSRDDRWLVRNGGILVLGRDVIFGRQKALALVESMRTKKLASLRKQIAKLEAMDVEAMVPKEDSNG